MKLTISLLFLIRKYKTKKCIYIRNDYRKRRSSDARSDDGGSSAGGGIGGCAAEEGEESGGGGSVLLVQKEILWNPKGGVSGDDGESEHESGDEDRSDAGEEDDEGAEADEAPQRLRVGVGATEDHERLVGGAEEVEEEPGAEEADKDEERDRIRQERHAEDSGDHGEVVHAEVRVILAEAGRGVGD